MLYSDCYYLSGVTLQSVIISYYKKIFIGVMVFLFSELAKNQKLVAVSEIK